MSNSYRPRWLAPVVEEALRTFPVVVLTGARQTGKSTLVRRIASAPGREYRTLDDLRVLELAEREPDLLVRESERLTLDEVQRAPGLLLAVKRAVDEERRPGRFLLTGSANLLLLARVSETLAGRAVYLRLGPMTEAEKEGRTAPPPWSALLAADGPEEALAAVSGAEGTRARWSEAACVGGMPPVLGLAPEDRARWFEGYVTTYLERDLQQLAQIDALADFRRLLRIAALRAGGLLNRSELARDAGLARATAHRYVNLLEVSYQVRLLEPYAVSRTKRLVKTPKLYWNDGGLGAYLAGIEGPAELAADPRAGAALEGLLLQHLDAWRETVVPRPEVLFRRTADGEEVDLVLEDRRRLLPIEVKASTRVRPAELAGLERFLDDAPGARYGLVAHAGDDAYRVTRRVVAVPVRRLL